MIIIIFLFNTIKKYKMKDKIELIFIILLLYVINFIYCLENNNNNNNDIQTSITNLQYKSISESFLEIDSILLQINNEYDLKKFHTRYISWDKFPGEEIILDELTKLLYLNSFDETNKIITNNQFKNQILNYLPKINENVNKVTDHYYNIDPGWMANGYFYCRYFFINTNDNDFNITALIFISFETEDKKVFNKITGHITNLVSNIPIVFNDLYYYLKLILITVIIILIIRFFFIIFTGRS